MSPLHHFLGLVDRQHYVIVQDDQETIADQYSVKVYPTVLFFENEVVSKRLDGVLGVGLDEYSLVKFIQQYPLHDAVREYLEASMPKFPLR